MSFPRLAWSAAARLDRALATSWDDARPVMFGAPFAPGALMLQHH